MPSSEEKARRKALKKAYLEEENRRAWRRMYLSRRQFESLLDYVDARLGEEDCDHTFRYTLEWADAHGVDKTALVDNLRLVWGQGCDCELFNIEDELYFYAWLSKPPDSD